MANYLYVRGIRQVDHTVFGVDSGQKNYPDPFSGRPMPYSSGQQVKRSLLDYLSDELGEQRAPITFNYEVTKKGKDTSIGQKEPWNPCNPAFADQLIGGWMRAQKGESAIKRRSSLSISALRPLHPSLANLERDESGTFDRSDNPSQHKIQVRDEKGVLLNEEEITKLLDGQNRSLPLRNWLKMGPRANGIFVYDIAIDLDRIFKISTNKYDPELSTDRINELKEVGWKEEGGYLVVPTDRQKEIISALASAIVNWRITSNQSRTFSPQGNMAIAISKNANKIVNAIRADLDNTSEQHKYKAHAVIDNSIKDVDLFVSLSAQGYIPNITGTATALDDAEAKIKSILEGVVIN